MTALVIVLAVWVVFLSVVLHCVCCIVVRQSKSIGLLLQALIHLGDGIHRAHDAVLTDEELRNRTP